MVTIDEMIAKLTEARDQIGGGKPVTFWLSREAVETSEPGLGIYFVPVLTGEIIGKGTDDLVTIEIVKMP